MSAHTPGPWKDNRHPVQRVGPCVVRWNERHRRTNGALIEAAPDLLAVANEASREAVLLCEMDELVEQRSAVDPCGDGLFGIGAHKDEHALKWQALREELNALVARRLAAIAKAEGKS